LLEIRIVPHAGHDHGSLANRLLDVRPDELQLGTFPALRGVILGGSEPITTGGPAVGGDTPGLIVPAYSSRPGAPASLYLDFNGHFEAQWGSYSNIDTPPYDIDGNPTAFSATELSNIQQIWSYVAEDFAPFNLNVTTVLPPSFANGVALRVAIGGNSAWAGGTYGGIAYIDAFTNSIVNTVYVFPANLGNGYPRYVADASSHESGHGFGLQHQSQWSGSTKTAEYYSGPGDGTAPLMGNSYSATRSLWWYGTSSTSATSFQNDPAVIARTANGFGFRTDDHGNTAATATPLTVAGTGAVSGSGVIEQMTDLDYFSFSTAAGTITLTVDVAEPYRNLDARLELRDATGNLLASADPSTTFDATITYNGAAGSYRLVVASHGLSSSATSSNYGFNVGQYTVTGTVVPTGSSAPAAPSNLVATAVSSSQINLSWTDNSSNEDGFKIERLQGSVWTQVATVGANVTSWQDAGLTGNTTYTYRVRAYNSSGDSAYSNTASATTPAAPTVPAAPSNLRAQVKTKPNLRVNLTWRDNASNETGFRVQRSSDGGVTWTQIAQVGANVTSYSDTSVVGGTTYRYRVYAYNAAGDSGYSNIVTASTPGSAGGGGGAPVPGHAVHPEDRLGSLPQGNEQPELSPTESVVVGGVARGLVGKEHASALVLPVGEAAGRLARDLDQYRRHVDDESYLVPAVNAEDWSGGNAQNSLWDSHHPDAVPQTSDLRIGLSWPLDMLVALESQVRMLETDA
jgi:hypothetical protein